MPRALVGAGTDFIHIPRIDAVNFIRRTIMLHGKSFQMLPSFDYGSNKMYYFLTILIGRRITLSLSLLSNVIVTYDCFYF